MSINRVVITGNLTRDGELRATQGGTQILRLGVAVNDRKKNQQTGQWEDVPNFVDCVMFGTRAEAVARYMAKGTHVAIEGRLRYSSWQDRQTGQNRSKLEVVVDEVEWSAPRGAQQPTQAPQAPAPAPAPTPAPAAPYAAPQQAYVPQVPAQPMPVTAQAASVPQAPVAQAPDLYDEDIPF